MITLGALPETSKLVNAQTTAATQTSVVEAKADSIIETGVDLIGKATYHYTEYKDTAPYVFGCGGYVYFVFQQNGIDIGTRNIEIQAQLGEFVPKSDLQKGDLLFFDDTPGYGSAYTHVGIYMGNNKMVHMADSRSDIIVSDLGSSSYYRDFYKTARRVIPHFMQAQNDLTQGNQIIETIESLVGKVTYGFNYNEDTLTFNTTGFAYYVFKQNGIDLESRNISEMANVGTYVEQSDLQIGDLVFFSNGASNGKPALVGIYAGNSQFYILSDSSGIKKSVILFDWYQENYVTARRVIDSNSTEVADEDVVEEETEQPPTSGTVEVSGDAIAKSAVELRQKASFSQVNDEANLAFNALGYARYVYKINGIELSANSLSDLSKLGQAVSRNEWQKGDLLFFGSDNNGAPTTVAIYIGNGEFIHPASAALGIRRANMTMSWYKDNFVTARRVIDANSTPMIDEDAVEEVVTGDEIAKSAVELRQKASFSQVNDEANLAFNALGYARFVYKINGIDLSANSLLDLSKLGQAVSSNEWQKGDLLFFGSDNNGAPTTVGIYIGNGEVIHPASSALGIRRVSITMSWYKDNFVTARRVL
ncbi:NlpC/P60 family protein [Bacillaceae bacterium IKA-2]|nr:NlpC/P60 family protein [Bacillaceae bacterium IKA-2]